MPRTEVQSFVIFIARLFLGIGLLFTGYMAIANHFDKAYLILNSLDLPLATLVSKVSGVISVIGGIAIILGLKTKWVSGFLIFYCLLTEVGYYFFTSYVLRSTSLESGDLVMMSMFFSVMLKNISMVSGLLMLLVFGPGAWSFDSRTRKSTLSR